MKARLGESGRLKLRFGVSESKTWREWKVGAHAGYVKLGRNFT